MTSLVTLQREAKHSFLSAITLKHCCWAKHEMMQTTYFEDLWLSCEQLHIGTLEVQDRP